MVSPPQWAEKPLSVLNLVWPDGDPAQMAVMSTEWTRFARNVRDLHSRLDHAMNNIGSFNEGQAAENMVAWWNNTSSKGLTNLASAADDVARSLKTTSGQVAAVQAGTLAGLYAMAPAIAGTGGLLAGLWLMARRKIIGLAVAAVGFLILVKVVDDVRDKTTIDDPPIGGPPIPRPTATPRPSPSLEPPDPPDPGDLEVPTPTPAGEKCTYNGNLAYTTQFVPIPDERLKNIRNVVWDDRVNGSGIVFVRAWDNLGDGSHSVMIDGVIQPTIGRQYYEAKWPIARESIGLPGATYDAAHLFGPIWGSEAAEGLLLAPRGTNRGAQLTIEEHIRWLNDQAGTRTDQYGNRGFVEVQAYANSHGTFDWKNPNRQYDYGGYLLLRRAEYDVKVCHPDGQGGFDVVGKEKHWISFGVPDQYGQPGTVTHSPLPPRH